MWTIKIIYRGVSESGFSLGMSDIGDDMRCQFLNSSLWGGLSVTSKCSYHGEILFVMFVLPEKEKSTFFVLVFVRARAFSAVIVIYYRAQKYLKVTNMQVNIEQNGEHFGAVKWVVLWNTCDDLLNVLFIHAQCIIERYHIDGRDTCV